MDWKSRRHYMKQFLIKRILHLVDCLHPNHYYLIVNPRFYSESEEPPMTENKNRVCCLYRVSTDKQVDFNSNHEADLPMQRKACHK